MRAKESPMMRLLASSLLLSLLYLFGLSTWFDPIWETNDDVAMAMVAHGYGFASYGSPNLLFSNVVWGHVVRVLHGLYDMQGYSVGTFGALLLASWSCLYFLRRLGLNRSIVFPAVAAIFAWPILFPQFTVNAGLLTIAAVLGWHTYGRTGDISALVGGCLLAILGFLVRSLEFLLIIAVAAPFLPWRFVRQDRILQIACALTVLCIAGAHVVDVKAYQSADWKLFRSQNQARAPYTDFGIASQLETRPDVLKAYGYSKNDIYLISNWFFVDPKLFDVSALNGMAQALGPGIGPVSASRVSLDAGLSAFSQLLTPRLLPLAAVAVFMLLFAIQPNLVISWVLFLAAVFGLGLVGATPHTRVIFPIIGFLVAMPVALTGEVKRAKIRPRLLPAAMLAALSSTAYFLVPLASASTNRISSARHQVASFGKGMLFVWGGALDFEAAYPVKLSSADIKSSPPLFALGVMTYAPFSVALAEDNAGRGFLERLQSENGIRILADDLKVPLMRSYCWEHLSTQLKTSKPPGDEHPYLRILHCSRSGG